MKKPLLLTLSVVALLASCSNVDDICEDVTLASEQIQQCQSLHKQIINSKSVLVRTELDRRYQQDCVDIRYYRDEKQAAICGNKQKIQEIKQSAIVEEQQL
jgi:thymidine kinase